MAWKEISVFEQRKLFIKDFLTGMHSISELSRKYEISRPTAYLWIERFELEGEAGLLDRISTPHNQPLITPSHVVDEILFTKFAWNKWGPKKIYNYLKKIKPELELPSITTIGNILLKNGLVERRKIRKRFAERTQPLAHAKEINDVWSVDFKGWFMTLDNYKCEPFTLIDNSSRYLLKCLTLKSNDTDHVWGVLDIAFREYGLPLYLRSDNGPPFASKGVGRLSRLSVNLIKAGVIPDFIDPGEPQQNGRHERMHGTLKSEAVFSDLNLESQRVKFTEFQHYYNYIRPHEAINQVTPASIYNISDRKWTGKFKSPEYPDSYKKIRVRLSGQINFNGKDVFIGHALKDEYIGLKEEENGFKAYYGPIYLADINHEGEVNFAKRKGRDRNKKIYC